MAKLERPVDFFEVYEARHGWARTALVLALVSQVLSFLFYFPPIPQPTRLTQSFAMMCADPFTSAPVAEPQTRHRILAPLIAYALGLRGPQGVLVPIVANSLFLVLLYRMLRRYCSAAKAARAVPLFGSTLVVLSSQTMMGCPDSLGHLASLASLYVRSSWALLPTMFLGMLGEERCILTSPLLLLWHYLEDPPERRWAGVVRRGLALGAAFGLWSLAYLWMRQAFRIEFPSQGVWGRRILFIQYSAVPAAYYFALRGAWLLPFWLAVAWRARPVLLTAYFGATLVALGPGVLVMDMSRSMAFAYPTALIALVELERLDTDRLRGRLDSALLLNAFTPQYNVVLTSYFPLWPLPLALVEQLFKNLRYEGVVRMFQG